MRPQPSNLADSGSLEKLRANDLISALVKTCLSGEHPPEDGEDRISWLPDGILLLILSFLKFNEMAQTSLLSRRWLYLWMDTQVLHFDYPATIGLKSPSLEESQSFVNRVNHFLRLHKSQSLKDFRITFYLYKSHKEDVSIWLEYALARKVESLELNFLFENCHGCFYSAIFDFDEFLKPNSEKGIHIANPDRRLQFRSLKSLSLKYVQVTGEAVDFILQNCPFLERLEVVGSFKLRNFVISDPKSVLKYLHIDCDPLEFVSISNINLLSLIISLNKRARGLWLTNLPMLVVLSIWTTGARDELRRVFSQSSCCLPHLRCLRISAGGLQDITQFSELARLTKLKRLILKVGVLPDERLMELVSFIHACPYLEKFLLMVARRKINFVKAYRNVAQLEICSLKCLKVFKFVGYCGHVGDLELVTHILENSAALEKIVIDPRYHYSGRTVEEEEESRSIAHQQFEGLRESIQPRVIIL